MVEHYTFADSVAGLARAFSTTLSLRRAGFKTRLVTRRIAGFVVHTVIATPPKRATRKERGCSI